MEHPSGTVSEHGAPCVTTRALMPRDAANQGDEFAAVSMHYPGKLPATQAGVDGQGHYHRPGNDSTDSAAHTEDRDLGCFMYPQAVKS